MPSACPPPRLVVFARWPEVGRVKSRLARTLGEERAARVYRKLLDHTVSVASRSGLPVDLRVTGAPVALFQAEFGTTFTILDQGDGDLGERLARIEPPALIIGSDLPGLTPALLHEAASALTQSEVVIGPARDGGYWLIGFQAAAHWLFDDMAWSTPAVLADTLARCRARGIAPGMLTELTDVDEAEDLADWPQFAS